MRRSIPRQIQKTCASLSPVFFLSAISVACLAPFLNKAFHVDDPLFLWTARHIQSHPFDFYGFSVNWYGSKMAMSAVTENPPLASYYIAVVAHFFGWKEVTLHAAFLVPALAAVIGTYYLAREFCLRPLAATLAGMLTPVFLLSSTSVMCDTMMLSLWVWATVLWIHGMKNDSAIHLFFAALLVAICSLTKYYGVSLIPLLFAYSLAKKRRPGYWTLLLLIPVGILAWYQQLTFALYGKGLLSDASAYAIGYRHLEGAQFFSKTLTGLSFTGGCFIGVLFYSLRLWRRRTLGAGAFMTMLLVFVVFFIASGMHEPGGYRLYRDHVFQWPLVMQCYLFALAGVSILCLAGADLLKNKDADSLLLFLWVAGTFVFASFLNWSVNGRSVLPMAPAIGMLIVRRMEQVPASGDVPSVKHLFLPLVPALVIALSVTYADYSLAGTARSAAVEIGHSYANRAANLWFKGHWGFQYYMEANGGKALDSDSSVIAPGDLLIIPSNNTNYMLTLPPNAFHLAAVSRIAPARWLTTVCGALGAGFFSDLWGPLPYAVGPAPDEEYYVFLATG